MHLALFSVRNVPPFAIVCAAPLAAAAEEVLAKFNVARLLQTAEAMLEADKAPLATAVAWFFGL